MTNEFRLSTGDHQNKLDFPPLGKAPIALTEKHRPKTLDEVVGQGHIRFQLDEFLNGPEGPYSCAMLFTGPSGTGKTTVALALAAELGAIEFGGLERIDSGRQDKEAVIEALNAMRHTTLLRGDGWKVCIVDEADLASTQAKSIWLSALEALPSKCIVVFTTNHADKFDRRFLSRCERFDFDGTPDIHMQDAQVLADRIWEYETGGNHSPRVESLPNIVQEGSISYRDVVQALVPLIARRKAELRGETSPPLPENTAPPVPSPSPSIPPTQPVAMVTPPARTALNPVQAPAQATKENGSIDWKRVVSRFRNGAPLDALAQDLGISVERVRTRLTNRGCAV